MSEFARPIALDSIGATARTYEIAAEPDELMAVAARFGLLELDALEAVLAVARDGEGVSVNGRVRARAVQACTISAEPVAETIDEGVALRLVPPVAVDPDAEIELDETALDTLPLEGGVVDLGEIAAETMALALDPYPRAGAAAVAAARAKLLSEEAAEQARVAASPFAVLKR